MTAQRHHADAAVPIRGWQLLVETTGDGTHFGLRAIERHVRPQSSHDEPRPNPLPRAAPVPIRRQRVRLPHIGIEQPELKIRGQDADDPRRQSVELDRRAYRIGRAAETRLPEAMADYGKTLPLLAFPGRKAAALDRLNAKQGKEVRRDPRDADLFRPRAARECYRGRIKDRDIREALALAPPLVDTPIRRSTFAKILIRILRPQHGQLLRRSIRLRPEEDRVQHTEHGRVGADRQREHGYGGGRKPGILAQRPHGVAQVLRDRVDEGKCHSFTVLLLHRFDRAKAAQRRIPRRRRIHSRFEVVLDLHLQMKAHFFVQLALQSFMREHATQARGQHAGPAHPRFSIRALVKPPPARETGRESRSSVPIPVFDVQVASCPRE